MTSSRTLVHAAPALMLEAVGRYAEAAKKEGRGRQDVSVVFDTIRASARAHG